VQFAGVPACFNIAAFFLPDYLELIKRS